jgi:glycosyltransferase involved in cell wall biosynthesis
MNTRLLIVTDTLDVDDLVHGYFHRWVEELALHAPKIHVLAYKVGYHTLPAHVEVHSLGEEERRGRIVRTLKLAWFLLRHTHHYDAVFVASSPSIVVRVGWWWKLWKKPIGLWYQGGNPTTLLAVARPLLSFIFTPTTHGYHGGGDIKRIVGYGLDVSRFKPLMRPKHDGTFRIVTVGAITSANDYETLIKAISLVHESIEKPLTLTVVGAPASGEDAFAQEVRSFARGFGLGEVITFAGPMKNVEVAKLHQTADAYVSVHTGEALEKSLIEAAASGLPILTANRAFEEFARDYGTFAFFEPHDAAELAERIRHMMKMSYDARHALGHVFRDVAVHHYSLDALAHGIMNAYEHVDRS